MHHKHYDDLRDAAERYAVGVSFIRSWRTKMGNMTDVTTMMATVTTTNRAAVGRVHDRSRYWYIPNLHYSTRCRSLRAVSQVVALARILLLIVIPVLAMAFLPSLTDVVKAFHRPSSV